MVFNRPYRWILAAAYVAIVQSFSQESSSTTTRVHLKATNQNAGPSEDGVMDRRSALIIASALLTVTGATPALAVPSKAAIPEWTLQGGVKMPTLALNTVGLSVEESERAIRFAV